MADADARPKPLRWVGDSRKQIQRFPEPVKDEMGQALWVAQEGGKHRSGKPLKGFKGAGVLEVVQDFDGDTYRAVYTGAAQIRGLCPALLPEEEPERR